MLVAEFKPAWLDDEVFCEIPGRTAASIDRWVASIEVWLQASREGAPAWLLFTRELNNSSRPEIVALVDIDDLSGQIIRAFE